MKIEELKNMMPGIYEEAKKRGFYDNDPSDTQLLMSALVEVAELAEAFVRQKRANVEYYSYALSIFAYRDYARKNGMGKVKPTTWRVSAWRERMFPVIYLSTFSGTVEDELADCIIILLSIAAHRGVEPNIGRLWDTEDGELGECTKADNVQDDLYSIASLLTNLNLTLEQKINHALCCLIELGRQYEVAIEWHIEEKRKYNLVRDIKK